MIKTSKALLSTFCAVAALGCGNAYSFTYNSQPVVISNVGAANQWFKSPKTDAAGNIYSALVTNDGTNGKIVKHSPAGAQVWSIDFDPNNPRPADKMSAFVATKGLSAVAVDRNNFIYAAGSSFNGTNLDILLKKYTASGTLVWQKRYARPSTAAYPPYTPAYTFDEYVYDMIVDPAGYIVTAGAALPFGSGQTGIINSQIIKWDNNGNVVSVQHNAIGVKVNKIVSDAAGNLLTAEDHKDGMGKFIVAKYDGALTRLATYSATVLGINHIYGIGVNTAGDVFLAGTKFEDSVEYGQLVVLDSNLNQKCTDYQVVPSIPGHYSDSGFYYGVVAAPNDHAILVGGYMGAFMAMEFDSQCKPQWLDAQGNRALLTYQVSADKDFADAVTLDDQNNLILSGHASVDNYTKINAVTMKFTRQAAPTLADLAITSGVAPYSGGTAQNVTISGAVKNQGTQSTTAPYWVGVYISTDSTINRQDYPICRIPMNAQAAGATQNYSCATKLPLNLAGGSYYIGAIADDGNVIDETVETNNTWAQTLTLTARCDLVLSTFTAPTSGKVGETITVSGTVKNQGIGTASGYNGGNFSVAANINAGKTICTASMAPMAPGAVRSFSCSGAVPAVAPGAYQIIGYADWGFMTSDYNLQNNEKFQAFNITLPADLVITSGTAPASAGVGKAISISGTVKNQGAAATSGMFAISAYVSSDAAITTTDTYVCYTLTGTLAAGASANFICSGYVHPLTAPGNYYIGLYANYKDYAAEADKTNNTWSAPIVITP